MHPHRVSVVIPTYNRAHLIERAVRSVLDQTFAVHEVIVIDDGSTDNTSEVVARLSSGEPRLTYISQNREGAPAARNLGISATTGSLIAFQDSDDEWRPTFIEELLDFHDRPMVLAFSSMLTVDSVGNQAVAFPNKIYDVVSELALHNCISTQTALLDASLLRLHQFDETLPRLQDWDLWLGLIERAHFVHHPRVLVIQHLQGDSITAGRSNLYVALRTITRRHWRVLIRHPKSFVRLWIAARLKTWRSPRWVRSPRRR